MKLDRYTYNHISFPTAPSISVILLLWITIFSTAVTSLPAPKFKNGTNTKQNDRLFVDDISKCPPLPPRAAPPTNVRDLRADDIKVIMGLGDSVIAGFGVRVDKLGQIFKDGKEPLDEYRGANFAVGGDPDVVSIPNILRKFSPKLVGDSKGTHIIEVCYGILCPSDYIPKLDQLNAAQSGAQALNVDKQVNYLIDQLSQRKDIDVKNDWKFATMWFGNNDLCNGCTDLSKQLQFSPDQFESHIREGLEKIRKNVPKVFINLMSVFKISQMFEASLKDKNCVLGKIAGLFLECQCAFVPGPLGDKSRKSMDDLADQYNERLKKITLDFQEKNYQDFIVSYDPGMENMDLSNGNLDLLSGIDCFHPSLLAHERIAKAVWNNIFTQQSQKTSKYDPTVDLPILCPNEDDRLR